MIFDVLDRKIKEMKAVHRLEQIKANQAQQKVTDKKYSDLVGGVHKTIDLLNYAHNEFEFTISEFAYNELMALISDLPRVIRGGFADRDEVEEREARFKKIQSSIKKEWNSHYAAFTLSTMSTLSVISGIDVERVTGCQKLIKEASVWSDDKNTLVNMKQAMDKAKKLIHSLNLDQEIIDFLTKMTGGRATILDLNESVLAWIRKEQLEGKVKLMFLSK